MPRFTDFPTLDSATPRGTEWLVAAEAARRTRTPPTVERRRVQRFGAQSSAFAVFRPETHPFRLEEKMFMVDMALAVFRSQPTTLGPMLDISTTGLAVQCFEGADRVGHAHVLDLLVAESAFYIQGLRFVLVGISAMPEEPEYGPLPSRRLSLRFDRPDDEQQGRIRRFIRQYAVR